MGEEKRLVPVWEKELLSVKEAAAYFGIGENKLRELTDNPDCQSVLWVGSKRLIKREKMKKYLSDIDEI
mgnify:FL=1